MFILLKVQSLQLSFRPAGVSLGGGGGARPPSAPPGYAPAIGWQVSLGLYSKSWGRGVEYVLFV